MVHEYDELGKNKHFKTLHQRSVKFLETFAQSNAFINHYRQAGKLIQVDAEAETEIVFRETIDAMRRFLLQDGWICSVIGAPGSGRTTQCRKLSEALKVANISWEELMKREIDKGNGAVLK